MFLKDNFIFFINLIMNIPSIQTSKNIYIYIYIYIKREYFFLKAIVGYWLLG